MCLSSIGCKRFAIYVPDVSSRAEEGVLCTSFVSELQAPTTRMEISRISLVSVDGLAVAENFNVHRECVEASIAVNIP